MKTKSHPFPHARIRSLFAAGFCLLPSLALAHPGHYHPDEQDEFDALRASFLHLHGNLEIALAVAALASAAVFMILRNRPARLAAALTFCGALTSLAVR
jgi:hypothetical protein